jgi:hypothetical protein
MTASKILITKLYPLNLAKIKEPEEKFFLYRKEGMSCSNIEHLLDSQSCILYILVLLYYLISRDKRRISQACFGGGGISEGRVSVILCQKALMPPVANLFTGLFRL